MPLLYGEGGRNAFRRLQEEIIKVSTEESIFAWHGTNEYPGALAESPADFHGMGDVKFLNPILVVLNDEYYVTNRGLRMQLPIKNIENGQSISLLACTDDTGRRGMGIRRYMGIYLSEVSTTGIYLREHERPILTDTEQSDDEESDDEEFDEESIPGLDANLGIEPFKADMVE
ncbi:hypothetical protein BU16DRAFT_621738 [Lophium mytilinum]|uniref:DUF8212 domain-containing protein n=1 Tax=Lophium mytilinum TaxID=390894 RepID=A0A6A6QFN1_9PEZI|nr:hypothetical protein BU16DRAFT_621738 [Lophium mytilinum]